MTLDFRWLMLREGTHLFEHLPYNIVLAPIETVEVWIMRCIQPCLDFTLVYLWVSQRSMRTVISHPD